jgi:hypothetical protein
MKAKLSASIKRACGIIPTLWFVQMKKSLPGRLQRRYGRSDDPEIREVMAYLAAHPTIELPMGMSPPYEWVKEYRPEQTPAKKDERNGLLYVTVDGHRVFFPRKMTPAEVEQAVCVGRMEQDKRSPHRYVGDGFTVDAGDVAVFVGASDGLFCLSLIERLSKAYLFEPCSDWHEPLRATLAPWGDRAEVVPLALGAEQGPGQTSLDIFFRERLLPNYIQVDVDGVDKEVLAGARHILGASPKLRLSLCAYHQRLDYQYFERLLSGLGCAIHHSPGFYLLGVREPLFRRGVLYALRGAPVPASFVPAG